MSPSAEPDATARRKKLQGLAVLAAVALPMLAAYIVFHTGLGMPSGTVNKGELLQPARSIQELPLLDERGEPMELLAERPRWRYLIVAGGDCDAECELLLYTSRQVHKRLSEKAERVERLLLSNRPLAAERIEQLRVEHPRLRFATVREGALQQLLAETNHRELQDPSALLVDQNGFAMMVYDNSHSGNQLLDDIKKLLKYSYER